jgi:hypothetical protein
LSKTGEVGRGEAAQLLVEQVLHPLRGPADVRDPERPFVALGGEEHQERVPPLVVHGQDVFGAHVVAAQLEQQVPRHPPHVREGAGAVVVLDGGEVRDVDEQEAEAALPGHDLLQLGQPLAVGNGIERGEGLGRGGHACFS